MNRNVNISWWNIWSTTKNGKKIKWDNLYETDGNEKMRQSLELMKHGVKLNGKEALGIVIGIGWGSW